MCMKQRPKIPLKDRELVRARARERCEDCGRPLSASEHVVVPGRPVRWVDRFRIESYPYQCWKCEKTTPIVVILGLVWGEKYKGVWDEEAGELPSGSVDNKALAEAINARHPPFYWDYSRTINGWYGMNHCQNCGARLGDYAISEWSIEVSEKPPKPVAAWELPWGPIKHPGEPDTTEVDKTRWGVIHHLDGIPSNNQPSNLRLLCVRCHDRRH